MHRGHAAANPISRWRHGAVSSAMQMFVQHKRHLHLIGLWAPPFHSRIGAKIFFVWRLGVHLEIGMWGKGIKKGREVFCGDCTRRDLESPRGRGNELKEARRGRKWSKRWRLFRWGGSVVLVCFSSRLETTFGWKQTVAKKSFKEWGFRFPTKEIENLLYQGNGKFREGLHRSENAS